VCLCVGVGGGGRRIRKVSRKALTARDQWPGKKKKKKKNPKPKVVAQWKSGAALRGGEEERKEGSGGNMGKATNSQSSQSLLLAPLHQPGLQTWGVQAACALASPEAH
jgi:hypothetical protein